MTLGPDAGSGEAGQRTGTSRGNEMDEEDGKTTIACATCGTKYTMPNIGILPVMNNCPACIKKPKRQEDPMKNFRGGALVGPRRDFSGHYEQDIGCMFLVADMSSEDGLATLVIQKNGLVVCRNWKKCAHHGEELVVPGKGVVACPETQWRALVRKRRGWAEDRHGDS